MALSKTATKTLPAQRIALTGGLRIERRAIFALALPLMLSGGVQFVLVMTDVWFIGRISTNALAAVAAVQGLIAIVVWVLGSVAIAVQTVVAQACGARRYRRAGLATWTALWGLLCVTPLFLVIATYSHVILTPFGLNSSTVLLASEFWYPRVCGGSLGAAVWVMCGFFNGAGQPRTTALISVATVLANVILNELFIFQLSLGIAGSAWATTVAQACGFLVGLSVFLSDKYHQTYGSRLMYKPRAERIIAQLRLGFPMGVLVAGDILALSLFQLMQVHLSISDAAATQIVGMLATLSYIPGFAIATAGTTLVGKAVGAGDREWAMRLGTHVIILTAACMGAIGVFLALGGRWILPLFVSAGDANRGETLVLGVQLLWIAAGYQIFDGFSCGSNSCLRGAGDAVVPASLGLPVSLLIFVPVAHSLTFAPGQGWVNFLPQFGWGAIGGWVAVLIYVTLLGATLFLRWRSRAWQKISL